MAMRRRLSVISSRLSMVRTPGLGLCWKMIQRACQSFAASPVAPLDHVGRVFVGPGGLIRELSGWGEHGVWRPRLTLCRAGATAVILCVALAAAAAPASAQPATPAVTPAATTMPDASASIAAFTKVREWVLAMKAPPAAPEGLIVVPAASVTLRLLGEAIGTGIDAGGDAGTVWRATREAIADAARSLPVADDALAEARRRELATQMTITLELAGTLVPLRERTFDEVDEAVSPGVHGLAARNAKGTRYTFPLSMLATGTLPGQALATLTGEMLGDPAKGLRVDPEAQPEKVAPRDGVSFFKFGVVQIGQMAPSDPGSFLVRGGRAFPLLEVSQATMREMGRGIATHLADRLRTQTEPPFLGLHGVYNPVRGRHEPDVAPASEQALVAAALASWGAFDKRERGARDAAASILQGMFSKDAKPDPTKDPRSAMLAVIAVGLAAEAGIDWAQAMEGGSARAIDSCLAAVKSDAALDEAGMLVWALSTTTPNQDLAKKIADSMYAPDAKGVMMDLASHSPWLVAAERVLGGGKVRPEAIMPLRALRERAYGFVLTPLDAGEEGADLVGGVVFPGSRPPLPTAQSLRIIAGLAMMLGDEGITPKAEFERELVRLMPCLRFARQLCADDWTLTMCREPAKARWGVRLSPWDPKMPGEASALALITVRETLEALEKRAK